MTDALSEYRILQKRLSRTRWLHQGFESEEEDAILDEMDICWWRLADQERDLLNRETPKSLIRQGPHRPGEFGHKDTDVWTAPGSPPRTITEVA